MNTLISFLRDSIWQGVSALVAIIAFLYFLFDRYITKDHVVRFKAFLKTSFWTAFFCFTFSGFIALVLVWSDGLDKTEFLIGWLSAGFVFFIVAMIVQIQDDKKNN